MKYTEEDISGLLKYLMLLYVLEAEGAQIPLYRVIQAREEVQEHYISKFIIKITGPMMRMDYWDIYLIVDLLECPMEDIPLSLNSTPLVQALAKWRLSRGDRLSMLH